MRQDTPVDRDVPAGWTPPVGAPPRTHWLREWSTALQPPRLALHGRQLVATPRGDGGIVVTVPGIHSPEAAMAPIGAYLRTRGHDVRGWGLGTNRGDVDVDVVRLGEVVTALVVEGSGPVAIVGWSAGGYLAREVARRQPGDVRHVVTYGTPAIGGAAHTYGAADVEPEQLRRLVAELAERDRTDPITVPITAILSRRDGIVDWRAQVDVVSDKVTHVEVGSSHLGLGLDPEVWLAAARALAVR